jgi:hypothetical protein
MEEQPPKFLTRSQLGEFLRERGFPIGESTLDKLCSPARGEGPPVAKWWGSRPLYTESGGLAWAMARARDANSVAA